MADPIGLYPLNDLVLEVKLTKVNTTTGAVEPLTTGTVSAFLATSPTATSGIDASLVGTCTHIGSGRWIIEFDAAILTAALLATHFASNTPYCIISVLNGTKTYVQLVYATSRAATIP